MRVDQDVVKHAKKAEVKLTAQLRSDVEKIEKLEFELIVWKGSNVSAPTSVQLATVHQEVVDLKGKLSSTQAMLEATNKESVVLHRWSRTLIVSI